MSAPDRIWTGSCGKQIVQDGMKRFETDVEYIRADLLPQWQPIETAPMDGTVLAFCPPYVEMVNSSLDGFCITNHGLRVNPTHWMPLPEPPEEK